MELNFLILPLLLCLFDSSEIAAQIEPNRKIVRGKIQFTELNGDVLYQIYDELDLESLISMQGTSKLLASITNEYFCHKCPNCSVQLNPGGQKYSIEGSHIILRENEFSLEFLRHFGNFIHSILFNTVKSKEVLPNITWPLGRVERFICYIDASEPELGVMSLDQLVPNVRSLDLSFNQENNYSFLDCELPHLEVLDINVRNEWNKTDAIDRLLRKNPQIRKFHVRNLPGDYAKLINELLPNLNDIFISHFDIGTDEIHFANVRRFSLFERNSSSIINLFMPQLNYLWFQHYTPELFDALSTFFGNHKQLDKLHVGDFNDFERLTELTAELTNLTELKLQNNFQEFDATLNVEEIIKFLEQHPNIMKLELVAYKNMQTDELRNRFGNEYDFDIYGSFQITMEKKSSP